MPERNDPVGGPPAGMTTTGERVEPAAPAGTELDSVGSPAARSTWSTCIGPATWCPRIFGQAEVEAPAVAATASCDAWKSVLSILP